jgi:hypothetical protein
MKTTGELEGDVRRLREMTSTPASEERRVILEWELESRRAEAVIRCNTLARILFEGYQQTGSMSVILPDGRQWTESPYRATSPINTIHNARDLAETMARAAIAPRPLPRPRTLPLLC